MTETTTLPRYFGRGVCRVCQLRRQLNADGRVAAHEHPNDPGRDCGGVGYLPDPRWTR